MSMYFLAGNSESIEWTAMESLTNGEIYKEIRQGLENKLLKPFLSFRVGSRKNFNANRI